MWGETLSPRWPEGWETIDAGGEAVRTTYTRKLTDAKYDADNPHCRECDCAACHYFYLNSGDCCEACEECDGESHVCGCLMFGDPE